MSLMELYEVIKAHGQPGIAQIHFKFPDGMNCLLEVNVSKIEMLAVPSELGHHEVEMRFTVKDERRTYTPDMGYYKTPPIWGEHLEKVDHSTYTSDDPWPRVMIDPASDDGLDFSRVGHSFEDAMLAMRFADMEEGTTSESDIPEVTPATEWKVTKTFTFPTEYLIDETKEEYIRTLTARMQADLEKGKTTYTTGA